MKKTDWNDLKNSETKNVVSLNKGMHFSKVKAPSKVKLGDAFTFEIKLYYHFIQSLPWNLCLLLINSATSKRSYYYYSAKNKGLLSQLKPNAWHTIETQLPAKIEISQGSYKLYCNLYHKNKADKISYYSEIHANQTNFMAWVHITDIEFSTENIPQTSATNIAYQVPHLSYLYRQNVSNSINKDPKNSTLLNNQKIILARLKKGVNNYSNSIFHNNSHNLCRSLIVNAAQQRALDIHLHNDFIYEIKSASKSVVFRDNKYNNSMAANHILSRQQVVKKFLKIKKLFIATAKVCHNYTMAYTFFTKLKKAVVLKTLKTSYESIQIKPIQNKNEFDQSWHKIFSRNDKVLIEEYIKGQELSIYVVADKAIAAYSNIATTVLGTGIETLEQLLTKKYIKRKNNPRYGLKNVNYVNLILKKGRQLKDIPKQDQLIQLNTIFSLTDQDEKSDDYKEIIELYDFINPSILQLAEKVVKAIPGLNCAKVSFIIEDFSQTIFEQTIFFNEINLNASIADMVFPDYGKPIDAPAHILDFSFFQHSKLARNINLPYFKAPSYDERKSSPAFSRTYKLQMEIIKQAAFRKNLEVCTLSYSLYSISSELRKITFRHAMTELTPAISRWASSSKSWTKELLEANGLNTPKGESFTVEEKDQAWQYIKNLATTMVLKPEFGSGGKGISTEVSTQEHFNSAWEVACHADGSRHILVEQYIKAKDYRIFVLDSSVVAVIERLPAYIIGDGIHSIDELIAIKNKARVLNPHIGAKSIKLTPLIKRKLQDKGLNNNSILKDQQFVQLHTVANIGSGGESKDVTDDIHPEFVKISIKAKKAIYDPLHAGIDLMAEDISQPPDQQCWSIIEINANPDIALHHFPSYGKARDVSAALLDCLFPENQALQHTFISRYIILEPTDKAKIADLSEWMIRNALLHSVDGWVKTVKNGHLKALFYAPALAIKDLLRLCKNKPANIAINKLKIWRSTDKAEPGFLQLKAKAKKKYNNNSIIQSVIEQGENNYSNIQLENKKYGLPIALIINEATKRHLPVIFHRQSHYEVKGKFRPVLFRLNTCDNTVVAKAITPEKHLTKKILKLNHIAVPQGEIYSDYDKALQFFKQRKNPVVIKPEKGSHGYHVNVNINNKDEFDKAWELASQNNKNEVIVEEYISGDDLRIITIAGKAVSAYVRIPANVIGNGVDNIQQLIDKKTASRQNNPRIRKVKFDRLEQLFKDGRDLDFIPNNKQRIQLASIANISAGGDIVEILEFLHPSILNLAECAVQSIPGLNVAGVDLLVENFSLDIKSQQTVIIEINSDPAISDAVFPVYGKANDIPALLLEQALLKKTTTELSNKAFIIANHYHASENAKAFINKKELQIALIKQAATDRKLEIKTFNPLLYSIANSRQRICFYQTITEQTLAVSSRAAEDRIWVKDLLKKQGLNIAPSKSFLTTDKKQAWLYAKTLNSPFSIKPRFKIAARGVSKNISSYDDFSMAWDICRATKNKRILIERYLEGKHYLIQLLGQSMLSATQCLAANITGDAEHRIDELIKIKNQQRLLNPYTKNKKIKLNRLNKNMLAIRGYENSTVLKLSENISLHSDTCITRGGDSIDVSNKVHADFIAIALQAKQALFSPLQAGIHIIAEDIQLSPLKQQWQINEIDTQTDLALSHFPTMGDAYDIAGALIDYLFYEKPLAKEKILAPIKN